MKAMICTSMKKIPDTVVKRNMKDIEMFLNKEFDGLEIVNNFIGYTFSMLDQFDADYNDKHALMCLGMGLTNVMAGVDYVVLGPGFINSRGCIIEALTGMFYGKKIIPLQRDYNTGTIEMMSEEDFKRNMTTALNIMIKNNNSCEIVDQPTNVDTNSILDILRG